MVRGLEGQGYSGFYGVDDVIINGRIKTSWTFIFLQQFAFPFPHHSSLQMAYSPSHSVNPAAISRGDRFDIVGQLEDRVLSLEHLLRQQSEQIAALQASMANFAGWAVDLRMFCYSY